MQAADSPYLKGGTSGIGAAVARSLASRGAQLVLLTQHPLTDPFLADFIMDMRNDTNNELITAEQVDLSSLNSIRKFATKWVDNAPPRRLDMVILCASTFAFSPRSNELSEVTEDGFELAWGVNYVANFHLLSLLSPALRAQPPDRDVRVIFSTCSSYLGGQLHELLSEQGIANKDTSSQKKSKLQTTKSRKEDDNHKQREYRSQEAVRISHRSPYATSKLAIMIFASAYQKHLSSYKRPDKYPSNARVIIVDPGFTRTPSTRRYVSNGSLLGLVIYLLCWPFWWLILKSPDDGAQTFLHAAMESQYGQGEGGWFLKECNERHIARNEIKDEKLQKSLWEMTDKAVQVMEKESAAKKAKERKENNATAEKTKADTSGNA